MPKVPKPSGCPAAACLVANGGLWSNAKGGSHARGGDLSVLSAAQDRKVVEGGSGRRWRCAYDRADEHEMLVLCRW